MSETPVENTGVVKPGTGQTEKGEDRNETVAPDGSTVYEQPQPEDGDEQNVGYEQPFEHGVADDSGAVG